MSKPEYERFAKITGWLIESDQKVQLFEFMLQHTIARHLASHFENRGFPPIRHGRMSDLSTEANVLVSALARTGREGAPVVESFKAAAEEWVASERWTPILLEPADCGPEQLGAALQEIGRKFPRKKNFVGIIILLEGILVEGNFTGRKSNGRKY